MALLALTSVLGKDVGSPIEVRLAGAEGWRLVELVGRAMPDGTIVLSLRDLTQRRRWEIAGGEDARFRSLVHNAASVTMLVTADGSVESVSGAITRLLGHDPERVGGRPLTDLVEAADRPLVAEAMARAVASPTRGATAPVTVEARLVRRDATDPVPFELTIVNLLDDPTVGGLVVSGHDVTRLRAAQDALEHLANHDALTGLANRAGLAAHLTERLARRFGAARSEATYVAFVDVDRFKPVNDLLGHDVGDELLVALAGRLGAAVRRGDLVARLGGDEFVVVAEVDDGAAAALLDRLEACVATPFELSVGSVSVQASIGLARATGEHSPEALLAEADAAMYSVKRARRGGPPEPSMTVRERRALSEELGVALAENQLVVHYQPVVALGTGAVRGYEALVRWQHPERGLLAPGAFLGVAEDSGRDDAITEHVLRAACADVAHLVDAAGDGVWVSVNASAAQLARSDFPDLVAEVLADTGLTPARLCIEVTERAILERPSSGVSTPVLAALDAIACLGVQLAIDDFGTGYSSLSHVVQFPLHVLKIDRSFVRGVGADRDRHSVVAALVALARNLGVLSVAEGIEDERQLEELRRLGCDLGQGYLLGRPAPLRTLSRVMP
jgi:diguanylate cyclase (GGDEF)-like protein/PAS domain S-box-containing protein